MEFTLKPTDAHRRLLAADVWRSAVLSGSVIGNDTGQHGNTSPTIVTLNGKEIGRITKSGLFRIPFDKQALVADPKKPLVFRVASGKNAGNDLDDQELGTFRLVLSKDAPPAPPKVEAMPDPPSEPDEPKADEE